MISRFASQKAGQRILKILKSCDLFALGGYCAFFLLLHRFLRPLGLSLLGIAQGFILAGHSQYYLRFLSRVAANYFCQPVLQVYVSLTDRCQYLLMSLLHYSIFRSVHYAPSDDGYFALNPLAPLIMLGMIGGTYKEQVHSEKVSQNTMPS